MYIVCECFGHGDSWFIVKNDNGLYTTQDHKRATRFSTKKEAELVKLKWEKLHSQGNKPTIWET